MLSRRRQRRLILMAGALILAAGALARLGELAGQALWDARYAPTPTQGQP
jgi:hypothetical protein